MSEGRKLYTLVLVRDAWRVLLGLKKRGFGQGKWNGFGGKVEEHESIVDGALRELREESSLCVQKDDMDKVGILQFDFEDMPDVLMEVHVFTVTVYEGEPQESEEMIPKWFLLADIPYHLMWADDRIWFPFFLVGRKFLGEFNFRDSETIMKMKLNFIDDFQRFKIINEWSIMSFRELRNFTEVMRALGYPRLISMENFRTPNFPLVAEILVWLLNRYDPEVEIPKDIDSEQDRVIFIRSVAQFMATKAHVKLNTKKLYQADGYAVKELLKITTLLYNAIVATKSLDESQSYSNIGNVKSEITDKLQDTKLCRQLASDITTKGAMLYDLFGQEVDIRGLRSAALARQIEINEIEAWMKNAMAKVDDEITRTTQLIENVASDEVNLDAKIEKKRNELERNQKRLQTLQKVRPAFMDDYERLEEELKRQYEVYMIKFRCLSYLEHLWGEYEWNEKEKIEERENTMRKMLEKMKIEEALNVDAETEDNFGGFDEGDEEGNAVVKPGSRLQRPKPTTRFSTPGVRGDIPDGRRKFGSMTGGELDESDSQLSDYDLELIDGDSKTTSDEEEVELDPVTTATVRKPTSKEGERQGSDDDF